jgi:hypothetical protein
VAHQGTFAVGITRQVGGMVAAAGFFGGLGQVQLAVEQRFDGAAGRFGGGAAQGRRVFIIQQAGLHGRLAQQFGAGALAQVFGAGPILRIGQHHAVDGGQGFDAHGVFACGSVAGLRVRGRHVQPA